MTGASGPGVSSLTSKKFTSRMSTNQSQDLRGGIFACAAPFGAPGFVSGGARLLFRCVRCPGKLIVTSFAHFTSIMSKDARRIAHRLPRMPSHDNFIISPAYFIRLGKGYGYEAHLVTMNYGQRREYAVHRLSFNVHRVAMRASLPLPQDNTF